MPGRRPVDRGLPYLETIVSPFVYVGRTTGYRNLLTPTSRLDDGGLSP